MNRVLSVIALAVGVTVLVGLKTASADLVTQDSSAFTYKYEMDTDPTASGDWTTGGAVSYSVADNVLTMAGTGAGYLSAAGVWPTSGISSASGYTVEMRAKILTDTGGNPYLCVTPDSGSSDGLYAIGAQRQTWDISPPRADLGAMDNTDNFHIFRLAQAPGASTFSAWRDGVFLSSSLPSVYDDPLNRFLIGSLTADCGGSAMLDYVRFTVGAYAPLPIPEPSALALVVSAIVGFLAYAWQKRK